MMTTPNVASLLPPEGAVSGFGRPDATDMLDTITTFGSATLGGAWPVVWTLVKIIALVAPLMGAVAYLTLWERKAIGWTQIRPGPNRVGPFGLLTPIAHHGASQRRQNIHQREIGVMEVRVLVVLRSTVGHAATTRPSRCVLLCTQQIPGPHAL